MIETLPPPEAAMAQRVKVLRAGLLAAAAGNLLLAAVTGWVLWDVVPRGLLLAWAATFTAIQTARLALWFVCRGVPGDIDARRHHFLFRSGALLSGAAWGALPAFLFPSDVPHQAFLSFVAAGITGAAVASLASDRISALLFITPALLPLIARLFLDGGELQVAMGIMVVTYLMYLIAAARRGELAFHETLALREKADRQNRDLRNAQRMARLGSWSLDIASGRLEWSDEVYVIYGRDPETFRPSLETYYRDLVHPDDVAAVQHKEQAAYSNPGRRHSIDHRVVRSDGTLGWVHIEGVATLGDNKQPAQIIGTVQDITERKQADAALQESEMRLGVLLSSSPVVIYTCAATPPYGATFISRNVQRLMGYAPEQFTGNPAFWLDHLHPEDRQRVLNELPHLFERGTHRHEYRFLMPDGSYRWFYDELRLTQDGDGKTREIVGYWQDIHDRRFAQEALRESESQLQVAQEIARIGYFRSDLRTGAIEWSDRLHRMLGYEPGEIVPSLETFTQTIAPEERERVMTLVGRAYSSTYAVKPGERAVLPTVEYRARRRDGGELWLRSEAQAEVDPSGRPILVQGTVQDITERVQTEARLRDSSERIQAVLNTVVDGIITIDEFGMVETFNPAAERIFGYAAAEVIGNNVSMLMPEPDRSRHDGYLSRFAQTGERRIIGIGREVRGRRKDGTVFPLDLAVSEMWSGDHRRFTGVVRDITARHRAEEDLRRAHAKSQSLLNAIPDLMLQIDDSGRFMDFHVFRAEDLAFPPEVFMGRLVEEVMPDLAPRIRAILEKLRNDHETQILEYSLPDANGRFQDWEARFAGMATGGALIIIRNISERKRLEGMKNEFVSTVSHELRTPLTSIRGSLGLLVGGAAGAVPEKARELIDIAHKNSERLSRLINDILDIEKIASGKMTFDLKPQALMPLVEQAVVANQGYAEQCGVSLRVVSRIGDGKVNVDTGRFLQVMDNLLSNAAKFSPAGATVEVAVEPCTNGYRVSITDRGPGIPQEFRSRVFEKFSQADASDTRAKGGTGLGLAITHEIVERLSGRIGFESEEGRGTTFWVELYEWRLMAPPSPDAAIADSGPRVLVVEDDADVARLLAQMLQHAGFAADIAPDAERAREMLDARRYDAMTLDLVLPGQDGVSFIRELRTTPKTRALPIVVVSAIVEKGRLVINGDFTAIDWLGKPIDEQRLIGIIRKVVKHSFEYRPRILHVEDDADLHRIVTTIVGTTANFEHARTLSEAHAKLALERYALVLLDLALPDGSGWELLPRLRALNPPPPVVVLSGRDITRDEARHVQASLVKSRTSNVELLDMLHRAIRDAGEIL